jgi:hypothetical protein
MKRKQISQWMRLRPSRWVTVLFLFSGFLACTYSTLFASLVDSLPHLPPILGLYSYNAFEPGASGFPAVGGTYTDPVFGGTVRRLTNTMGQRNTENIYGHHWANADGTYAFSDQMRGGVYTGLFILNTATGTEAYTSQPEGSSAADISWHPTDPNKYYYYSGASLMLRNLPAQTSTTVKTFAGTLQTVGGSVNWIDRTGRYMVIKYSGIIHLWDSQTDTLYAGAFAPFGSTGWTGITPDGNYIVDVTGPSAQPQAEHYSYAINHSTHTISGTPVQFWGLSGDHGDLVSASNGKNYYIAYDEYNSPGIWRIDITLNQAGKTYAQQQAANTMLITMPWTAGGHFSGVSVGALSDWVFYSPTDKSDAFDQTPVGWYVYEQEIVAINVLTSEKRRLAHHRSRSVSASYYNFPRVSCSWDGSLVLWTSNFNVSSPTGYSDLYATPFPGSASAPPPSPTDLRAQ